LQRVIPEAPVEIVCNGLEALEAVHRRHFDLVLMDLHMPLLDGLEASRLLNQQLPPERRPVVVAVSADTLQALHEQCREAGIREFICKPFRVEDVQRVLDLVRPPAQQQQP
jgi:CheY-like chemotaxis protein